MSDMTVWQHPTGASPESVMLVSLGPSKSDFIANQCGHHPKYKADEIWTLNTGIQWCRHDLAFVMDDMQEFATHMPEYGESLVSHDKPIITSTVYEQFTTAIAYPLREILDKFGQVYFNNSVPYVIAYALYIGVKQLTLFGADYTYPGLSSRESGRGCVEYWIGYSAARGMHVSVCQSSTLLDARDGRHFYGYLRQPVIDVNGRPVSISADNIATYRKPCAA